jgi:hypothetical protein
MKSIILFSCFLPLIIVWIVLKLSVWVASVNEEKNYVREDSKKPHGPYVANAYADIDEEEEEYGDRTDYR